MKPDAWVPLLATQVSLIFALSLSRRYVDTRRPHLGSWALSLWLFTAGAGALWYGTAFGWTLPVFRVYYVCGALLSVPWLAMGQVQLLASRRTWSVVLLALVGFSVVAGFLVGFSPLRPGAVLDPDVLPQGSRLLGTLPRVVVGVSNGVGAMTVLVGVAVSAWRQRGGGPAARSRTTGVLLIAAGVLAAGSGGALAFLGRASGNALGITVGVIVIYAGFLQAGRRVGRHRSGRAASGRVPAGVAEGGARAAG